MREELGEWAIEVVSDGFKEGSMGYLKKKAVTFALIRWGKHEIKKGDKDKGEAILAVERLIQGPLISSEEASKASRKVEDFMHNYMEKKVKPKVEKWLHKRMPGMPGYQKNKPFYVFW